MPLLRGYIRSLLIFIFKICVVFIFKVIGPPRVLRYGGPVNIALLKAFGAEVGQNLIVCSPIVLHNARGGYNKLTIKDNCCFNGYNFLGYL